MENKAHALVAGLFTIMLLIAAILIGLWFNRDRVERVPYEIATKLSIPGLSPQAAVRYRGLDIGRVDDITFDPKVPGQILIHISVRPDTPITKSTFAVLGSQGVTGIAYIQLDDDGRNPVVVTSSKKHVARIDMRPSLWDQLQDRGMAILEQTEELTKRFNRLLDPPNQTAMLAAFDKVGKAADKVGKAADEIESIPRQLGPTLAKLPVLAVEAKQTLASISALAKEASALSNNLNTFATRLQAPDGAVAKLSAAADQFGAAANRIEFETLPLTHDARTSLRTFNRTLENFTERPQSLLFGTPSMAPGPGEPGFTAPNR